MWSFCINLIFFFISFIKNRIKIERRKEIKNIFDFKYEDITIENYQCHPHIKADVAV